MLLSHSLSHLLNQWSPSNWLPEELITGGVVIWLIIALALVCYSLLLQALYCSYKKQNLAWLQSWLTPLQILISALPLLGLLGTIIGLLDTFAAISNNSALSMSDAIGKALLTTQAGLLVAIPAMVMLWKLQRTVDNFAPSPALTEVSCVVETSNEELNHAA
ncbi:MotA/TolQ/ExbB proton channel family protein [Thalassotalea euphylliae]|uniref:MotA/TolQ/ExbB proton channel family protein n=1 Tax=Thalassotalea euphylliae TaxID=1655234 RepID=A0A3E0TQT5_9GAMM|nr:MotA/TolQ/ExbB proton channel family protein [Thalassotalea euphylliae]REL26909.1 MotA/TolQ/ExbB proton channel family protein [Thalassotalea euphylliae]